MLLVDKILAQTYDTALEVQDSQITFQELVTKIANIIGIVAGALAFIYLLYAGILYITAGGNPDQAKKAQTSIINAIIGIIIIVLAYIIFSAVRQQAATLGE